MTHPASIGDDAVAGPPLEFTGERFTPECVRQIWYEHWPRYVFARAVAPGRRVLDAACGEGYGSAMLAAAAVSVLGVDIADPAVAHARQRYAHHANLRFEQGDCTALTCADAQFDMIVSFETLEHVAAQEALIAGFARALAPDGLLIVSSPDKRTYSEKSGFRNEFHVRENVSRRIARACARIFRSCACMRRSCCSSQRSGRSTKQMARTQAATSRHGEPQHGFDYEPLYYIAVCARKAPSIELPGLALFGDAEESVYAHYNHEIRKNMSAGGRIAELESELAALRQKAPGGADVQADSNGQVPPRRSGWRRWLPPGLR
jgi:ubiquinone/menaquinone biosynthesis C-methylase UbiE